MMPRFIIVCVGKFAAEGAPKSYQIFERHDDDDAYHPATGLQNYGIGNNWPTRLAGAVAKLVALRDATDMKEDHDAEETEEDA